MKNRRMLLLALFSIALVSSLVFPGLVMGASATLPQPNGHSISDLAVESVTASTMALSMSQGLVTPMVAAGFGYAVGLKSDGTVVAIGDNALGQCNVDGWTDIVQVTAGGLHTVGLKSDGTVVTVGANWEGQCDVGGWTDITRVATGGWHTVGLKSDGTVVAVGYNACGECNVGNWTDIIQVAAGGFYTVGLKSDGTLVAVGSNGWGECNIDAWTDIIQIAAGGSQTLGLKSDGTVVATGYNNDGRCNVGDWTDIIQVAAGGNHNLGLKADGTVVAAGDLRYCNVVGWTDIIQVAAGEHHTVGLKADGKVVAVGGNGFNEHVAPGWIDIVDVAARWELTVSLKSDSTVVAVGDNAFGQCDVGNWTDVTQVATGHYHTVGLSSGGTVVAVGDNGWGQCNVTNWTNIVGVAAGDYHTVGLSSGGTVVVAGSETELAKILLLIEAKLHSPAEFRVYDSQGHVTGVINGEVRDEIRWATFNQEDESITTLYGFDTYFYEVEGIGTSTYGLTMGMDDDGQTTTFTAENIPITPGAIHRYHVDWGALSQGKKGVTVQVDTDGDGIIDYTITADNTLTGDEFAPQSGFCFIATATYGTPMAEEVQILREFRDDYLLTNPLGQAFVNLYYNVSPPIAEFITEHPSLKPIVRTGLLPVVAMSTVVVNTSPAEKMAIIGLVVLVSVAVAIWVMRRRVRGPEYT